MPRERRSLPRLAAIVGLGFLIAVGAQPGASLAKGGDHEDGGHGSGDHGSGGGHGNGGSAGAAQGSAGSGAAGSAPSSGASAANGPAFARGGDRKDSSHGRGTHGSSGDHGNGGSAAQGNTSSGSTGSAQSSGASAANGPTSTTTGIDLGAQEARGPANSLMLGKAVVALNAAYAVPRRPTLIDLVFNQWLGLPRRVPDGVRRPAFDARVQQMATYDRMMLNALQMPTDTPEQQDTRDRAIADARIQLAAATHRRLNPAAVSRIDSLLGLPATDPRLGVW